MKNKIGTYLLSFFLQPTLTTCYCTYRWWEKESRLIIVLFTILVGYAAEPIRDTMDLHYYLTNFIYGYKKEPLDFYLTYLREIVISFTNNSHIFLAVAGLVLGIFVSKSLKRFTKTHNSLLGFILVFIFLCSFNFYMLGGIRFVTAFYVFFYGVSSYIETKKKKYILILSLSALVHYTYVLGIIIFFTSLIIKKFSKVLKYLVVLSFLFSLLPPSFSYDIIFSLLLKISGFYQQGIEFYANVEGAQNLIEATSKAKWYTLYAQDFLEYTILVVTVILYRKRKFLHIDSKIRSLIIFTSLFFIFINIFQYVPHLGLRFSKIYIAFAIYSLYHLFRVNQYFPNFKYYIASIGVSAFFYIAVSLLNNIEIFPLVNVFKPLFVYFI